jgi:oligosaccharyltransferase complex subunit beta
MRLFLSFLVLAFLGLVQALSSSGSRLVVVLEEAADKALFSKFWADLEGAFEPCSIQLGKKLC